MRVVVFAFSKGVKRTCVIFKVEKPKREMTKAEILEKKRRLKEKFDAEYDDKDGEGHSYYDGLKQEMSHQAEVSFDNRQCGGELSPADFLNRILTCNATRGCAAEQNAV